MGASSFFQRRKGVRRGGGRSLFFRQKGETTFFHRKKRGRRLFFIKKRERRLVFIEAKGVEDFFSKENKGAQSFLHGVKSPELVTR